MKSNKTTSKQIQIRYEPGIFKMAKLRSNWAGDWMTLWVDYNPDSYKITYEDAKQAVVENGWFNKPWQFHPDADTPINAGSDNGQFTDPPF